MKAKNCNIRDPTGIDKVDLEYEKITDPDKFEENYENGVVTTIGQLNFFKWCIEKRIFPYIIQNLNEINKSMPSPSKKDIVKEIPKVLKSGSVYKTIMHVTVQFN